MTIQPFDGMGPIEQFVVLQAIYKTIAEELKTGVSTNLRGAVTDNYRQVYELTGATSFDIRLEGEKVGTFSFAKDKGASARTEHRIAVTDSELFDKWLRSLKKEDAARYLRQIGDEIANDWFNETGEIPIGCTVIDITVPARKSGIKGDGTARINSSKVAEVMGAKRLGTTIAGLLEGDTRE